MPSISQWTLLWPIIISGIGSGFIFVPLSTTAVAGMRNEEIGNATGLYNLLRNLGGSVGISLVETFVARREQVNRAHLVHTLNAENSIFRHTLDFLRLLLQGRGTTVGAPVFGPALRAYDVINGILKQQSALLAYIDDFWYLAILSLACVPLVFVLRKTIGKKGAIHAAH